MENESTFLPAVMEGGGAYNRCATFQAAGARLATPFLEKAAREIPLDKADLPIVIADYGSSQGKNSLAPIRIAIGNLRARLGPHRPISVFHVDQPANDFNTLFEVLDVDPDRYALDDANVFPCAIGRSFYENVLPPDSVHLGWCAYAAVWLSRIPTLISGHFIARRGTTAERAAFHRQAAQDWETFLSLRARELRPGGRLVVVLPALNDEGAPSAGFEALMDHANAVLAEMVDEGTIRPDERKRMVVGSYARRSRDLLAPFEREGHFQGLSVECCDFSELVDPSLAASDPDADANTNAIASHLAQIFRATYAPSLASALAGARNGEGRAFADRLESGLKRRLANQALPLHTFVQTMVLAKQDSTKAVTGRRPGKTFGELLHTRACESPDRPALFCKDRTISYRDLDGSSTRLARWLIDQGPQPGDRVAIYWSNSIEAVQILFGIFKAGLIAVPVNLRLKSPEVAWILEHSQSVMCFSEPALAPIAEQACPACPALKCILTELPALAAGGGRWLPEVRDDQPAAILYTSGSTARPKGVTHTHRTLREAVRIFARDLLDSEDIALAMTPMMHAIGLSIALLPAVSPGTPAVLLPAFEPGAVLDAIERFRCTFTLGLPALMQLVVEEQARKPRDVSSLRTVLAAGDCVPVKLQERFAELFGLPLQEAIGLTETFPVAINPKLAIRPGSLGVPSASVEVRIVDAFDKSLADGETGEMAVRSPANCVGYWNDPAATEALLGGGWLHTGDLGSRDCDGYLWFKGRKKLIIIRAGSNISSQEVEEVLYRHPAVFEVAVVGAPDPLYGEIVVAFVSLREGAAPGERELREYARTSLADYKVPEKIYFLPELPMGLTGKLDRSALKAMLMKIQNPDVRIRE
jgi:long-chain acyl-CoA synthetase